MVKHDSLLDRGRQERPFDLRAGHRRQIRQGGAKGLLPAAPGAAEGDVRMGNEVHGLVLSQIIRPGRQAARTCSFSAPGLIVGSTTPGGTMPTIIGHHEVKDRDHWLASPKREEFFGPLGVTNIRTFIDPENPSRVAVLMDVADMDALTAAMQSPGAVEAMEHDGVLPETLVLLVEA
jgi:hypothetical protein